MHRLVLKSLSRTLVLIALAGFTLGLAAQDAPKPAAKNTISADSPSRWDFFAGYSYLAPNGTVDVLQHDGSTIPVKYDSVNVGELVNAAYFFNRYVGGQVEVGIHEYGVQKNKIDISTGTHGNNDGFTTVAGGIIFRYPGDQITPFVHGLVGGALIDGPEHEAFTWGPALTVGGGVDYATPLFHHRLGIRVFQADFEYMHANFGPIVWGGRANIDAARLSTGLVYHMGSIAPPPQLTVACSANPTAVFPGDPVNLTSTIGSQNPKLGVVYAWSGDGVKGDGDHGTVDTSALSPGVHTVKCNAKEGKPGKEGLKPWQVATEGSTSFTVKEFEPPTMSCSASPTTIKPGDTSTITCQATSPQNRPLTYTYTASAGTVNGSGNTATFSSTGAPTGPVSITGNVADDKGHSASSNSTVTILAPPPPPQPHTQALCSINFTNDKKRPTRVDNEAKACLDEVALDLQKQTDAKAVVVGESNAKEKAAQDKAEKLNAKRKHPKDVENTAAQRAANTKEYLVTDKGIDPSRITVSTGTGDDQKVENYLVPSGANFGSDVQGTSPVDESKVKAQVRKPLPERHHKQGTMKK